VLLNEGDTVIVENPTYLALLSAWRPGGVRFVPVSSDDDGMRVEELALLLSQRPKLVYSTPNFQNPQGTTLSLERRRRLVSWLRDHEVALLEDNPYSELRYDREPIPDVWELGAWPTTNGGWETNVIHVGTFSKVLAPGLRVGYVIGAEPVIEKLVQAKQAADLHTSTVCQYLTHELVLGGFLDRHVPWLCQVYRERRDTMLATLGKYFPSETTWTRPDGGMF